GPAVRGGGGPRAPRPGGAPQRAGRCRGRQHPALCARPAATRARRHAGHRSAPLDRHAAVRGARVRGVGAKRERSAPARFGSPGSCRPAAVAMNAVEQAEVERDLAAARARLIVDKPFIGVLLLHLPFEPVAWCDQLATDARRIYYNPAYVRSLSARQLQFVLAHEALHCALGHFARRGHRLVERWDTACDLAVNLLLVEEGFEPVPQALIDPRMRGLSAEEIYPLLETAAEPGARFDMHLFGVA